jgi:hypothetical protein
VALWNVPCICGYEKPRRHDLLRRRRDAAAIGELLKNVSRRSFFKAAGAASAVALAVLAAVTVEHHTKEVEIEGRIRGFLEARLNNLPHFVWDDGRSPVAHRGNSVRYSPLNNTHESDNVWLPDAP